ncbi:helix-turn-helix domain-containing protein [bacterium]|nr:helix-turn-helix domain-containing protein [bacterium]
MEPIRNLRTIIREKNISMEQIANATGIQRSTLELIMLGVYVPSLDSRIKLCRAIDEPYSNTIFETGLKTNLAPLG